MSSDIVPIGGFPSIIPKDLYNKIEKETKRGKDFQTKKKISIEQLMFGEENKSTFIVGGDDENIRII